MKKLRVFRIPALLLLSAQVVFAHPYLPLEETSLVHDYKFHMETEKAEFKQPDVSGLLKVKSDQWQEFSGEEIPAFRYLL